MSASSTQQTPCVITPFMQRCQRLVWVAPRPEAVGEPKKIDFVDNTKDLGHRALDDFVFQRRHTERPLAAIRFRNINSAHRQRPIAPGVNPLAEILQTFLQILLVGFYRFPVDSRTRTSASIGGMRAPARTTST